MTLFDRLSENAEADTMLLRTCDEQGDDFRVARDVDFLFRSSDQTRAEDMIRFINGHNYGKARLVDSGPNVEDRFCVEVIIYMPITQHIALTASGFMLCLSRLFQVDYDGWGSVSQGSARNVDKTVI